MGPPTYAAIAMVLLCCHSLTFMQAFVLSPLPHFSSKAVSTSVPVESPLFQQQQHQQQHKQLQRQQLRFSSFWLDPTRTTPLEEWCITEEHPGIPSAMQNIRGNDKREDQVEALKEEDWKGRSIGGAAPLHEGIARAEASQATEDMVVEAVSTNEESGEKNAVNNKNKNRGFNVFKAISGGGTEGCHRRTHPGFFGKSKSSRVGSSSLRPCNPSTSNTRSMGMTVVASASASSSSSSSSPSTTTSSFLTTLRNAATVSGTTSSARSSSGTDVMDNSLVAASQQPQNSDTNMQVLINLMASDEFKRLLVWFSFLGLGWKLRSFYGIILGTFVLSYIGSSAVRWSEKKGNEIIKRLKLPALPRRFWACAYIVLVLSSFVSLTVVTVPRVVGETNYLALLVESENPYFFVADGIRGFLGPDVSGKLEAFLLSVTGEEGRAFASGVLSASSSSSSAGGLGGSGSLSAAAAATMARKGLGQQAGELSSGAWTAVRKGRFAKLMEYSLKGYIKQAYYVIQKLLTSSTKLVYKGVLSLLFSFMIIWDLPRLAKGTQRLGKSRFGFAYNVLAPQVAAFGRLVGQSFEVQSVIALVNTLLTTLGLILLKIPGYGFMSLVVLITSFIPVFGVFLSTFPMALVAVSEYGVGKMIDVILMVIGIHVVEAYCLSPLIYSATVKLHPVLIVSALYVMEHLAGLQGVFLAVPVTMFVIRQVLGIPAGKGGGGHGGHGGGKAHDEQEGQDVREEEMAMGLAQG
ncbi:hypothetical protein VYU27_007205 [Nannochloropsis oceanica]